MIVYSVQCAHGHVFDEWFSNSADYDAKAAAGQVACPTCGDTRVSKAIMAPNVAKSAAPAPMPHCPMGGCQGGACAFAHNH
jgi:hypothetical protein